MDAFTITLIVVSVTTVWVAVDSSQHKIPISGDDYNLNTGALAWFLSCVVLWIATFPYYLVRRSQFMAAPARPSTGVAAEIRELKALLDDGAITQDEFDAKKRELLKGKG